MEITINYTLKVWLYMKKKELIIIGILTILLAFMDISGFPSTRSFRSTNSYYDYKSNMDYVQSKHNQICLLLMKNYLQFCVCEFHFLVFVYVFL